MIKIFLLLIISFQVSFQLLSDKGKDINLANNNEVIEEEFEKEVPRDLIFTKKPADYYVTLLSLTKDAKINIQNIQNKTANIFDLNKNNSDLVTFKLHTDNSLENKISLITSEKISIEITYVVKSDITEYEKIDYNIDQEIPVKKNNFVIFLTDSDEDYEKFDMKFNFKDDIKEKTVHYGFICLPTDSLEYIALGKQYSDLKDTKFDESAKEITVENQYYEKDKDKLKKHFAFIFSIDTETEKIGEYSFTINSEIINAFLIVSIVIALVFAVITFFLIRRKQSSESTTIEGGGENFYQNKAKDEKEEKEEKDEKEESTEN